MEIGSASRYAGRHGSGDRIKADGRSPGSTGAKRLHDEQGDEWPKVIHNHYIIKYS